MKMRTGQSFSCTKEEPVLPRLRKLSRCLDNSSADHNFFSGSAEDWHKVAYFEVLDLVIESIKDCFDKPGYAIYCNLEELLVKGAVCEKFADEKKQVCHLLLSENTPVSLKE